MRRFLLGISTGLFVAGCGPSPAGGETGSTGPNGGEATATTGGVAESTGEAPVVPTTAGAEVETTTTTEVSTTGTEGTTSEFEGSSVTGVGTEETGAPPCNQVQVTVSPVVPSVLLVLDKSTYMDHTWDHDGDANTAEVTRWRSLHEVVEWAVETSEAVIDYGAKLYPAKEATNDYSIAACPVAAGVEVPVAAMNAAGVLAGIPGANSLELRGAMPAAAVMMSAFTHLKSLDPAAPRVAVFVTSDAANCAADAASESERFEVYDPTVHSIVAAAFTNDGIPTYVVGLEIPDAVSGPAKDGSPDAVNPFAKLNQLAVEGGRPREDPDERFFAANDQIELHAAMATILEETRSCVLALGFEPSFPEFVEVVVQDAHVPRVTDCASEDGWMFTHPDGPFDEIVLCGAACQNLMFAGSAEVSHFCETI